MFLKFIKHVNRLPTVEEWAERNSNKATPDGIIAAAVVQSLASHLEDWKGEGEWNDRYTHKVPGPLPHLTERFAKRDSNSILTRVIHNIKTDTKVVFHYQGKGKDDYGTCSWFRVMDRVIVNGLQLDATSSRLIVNSFLRIIAKLKAAEDAATKAKADMERNEQAWNLAEKLLGMKRNEFGALVPVKTAEGNDEDSGQVEQTPTPVRRKASQANRTPKRAVRKPTGALDLRPLG